ncbi:MAG: hypothetical protein EH225_09180, partial [Calditrichaeota bacterium]
MNNLMVLAVFFTLFTSLHGTIPPMKGGPLPEKVREHTEMMQSEYPNSNMAHIIQKWVVDKQKAILNPEIGINNLETLTTSFPVLVGKYADAVNVQTDAPQQLQAELFDGPWPTLTMREFYLENSYNQFELDGMVYGWIEVSGPESLYTGPYGTFGMGGHAATFVREMIDSVDAYVNFADFDNDGDG